MTLASFDRSRAEIVSWERVLLSVEVCGRTFVKPSASSSTSHCIGQVSTVRRTGLSGGRCCGDKKTAGLGFSDRPPSGGGAHCEGRSVSHEFEGVQEEPEATVKLVSTCIPEPEEPKPLPKPQTPHDLRLPSFSSCPGSE